MHEQPESSPADSEDQQHQVPRAEASPSPSSLSPPASSTSATPDPSIPARSTCHLPQCKATWPKKRPDLGIDHLARTHDFYHPGDKNTMSTNPRHLIRKSKALLITLVLRDREVLRKVRRRLRKVGGDSPRWMSGFGGGEEVGAAGLRKLGNKAVIQMLIAVRLDILAGEEVVASLEGEE